MLGFSTDDMNLGIGVRGGKTLDNRVYIGGSFVYHLGTSTSASAPSGTGTVVSASSSSSLFYLGPEGGYDFSVKPVIIRPYMGLGIASIMASVTVAGTTQSNSATKFVVWPGCTVLYTVPNSNFFIGGDLRFVTVPGGPGVGFFAFGGLYF